jgi:hypothetical protein
VQVPASSWCVCDFGSRRHAIGLLMACHRVATGSEVRRWVQGTGLVQRHVLREVDRDLRSVDHRPLAVESSFDDEVAEAAIVWL